MNMIGKNIIMEIRGAAGGDEAGGTRVLLLLWGEEGAETAGIFRAGREK